ncbi:glycosyltransferase family 2 protein [bacterium]|nr:glycosyltransferase family 2 protein [bacterium]
MISELNKEESIDNPDISIVVVNYRVKEYILLLLDSIQKATKHLSVEIFVVDNNSDDGSPEYLISAFKGIKIIKNDENIGFARANNQAIEKASGTYTLIINPDTVIQEDSLLKLKDYMDGSNKTAALGFKMFNPDGTFARESKRSVPDLRTGIFRASGLDKLLPNSRLFGRRYLGWIDENEVAEVPVISGAGMFWRTSVLKELQGFDEAFFMYGEDDDLCYRVQNTDFSIRYFPPAKMLHFKGESEREMSLKSLKKMNKGLAQFFTKHYKNSYNIISRALISFAFNSRTVIQYLTLKSKNNTDAQQEKINSVVILHNLEKEFPDGLDNDIKNALKLTSENLDFRRVSDQNDFINISKNIVFDTSSVTYTEAFSLMEKLNEKEFSFYFLLSKQKLIVGKSRIFEL